VGVLAAASVAQRYGENEGGSFCNVCFLRWAALVVPAAAAGGALAGKAFERRLVYESDAPGPSVLVTPVLLRQGGGVLVAARF
jgi:hypothetical protein